MAERGERLADSQHVRFGDAHVERPALIHRGDARLETARRREVRVDRYERRVPREHFHRRGHDVARSVFLRSVEAWKERGVVLDLLVPLRRSPGQHRAEAGHEGQIAGRLTADIEVHLKGEIDERLLHRQVVDAAQEPVELVDATLALLGLQRSLLFDERVRHRDLVLVQEIGQGAVALRRVTDDRRRSAVARTEPELLERGMDAVVLRRIDALHGPVERREHALEIGHREDHAVREVELTVVPVDHHAEIVEVLLAGVHHRFPDRPFLQFAVASQAVHVEPRRRPAGDREPLRDRRSPVPWGQWQPGRPAGADRDAR